MIFLESLIEQVEKMVKKQQKKQFQQNVFYFVNIINWNV